MSPTLENLVVLTWLRLVHPDLPSLVKQRYGTELRSKSLASLKPEISQALDSLLEEISNNADVKILRAAASKLRQPPARGPYNRFQKPGPKPQVKSCPLCKQAGRNDLHFLSQCTYLPSLLKTALSLPKQVASMTKMTPPILISPVHLTRRSLFLLPIPRPGLCLAASAQSSPPISMPSTVTTRLNSPWTLEPKTA